MTTLTSGTDNVAIGYQSGSLILTGTSNIAIGRNTLTTLSTGSTNIAIGHYAGSKHTGSSTLIIDNQQRADVATELTNAILYGVMAAAPANQTLRINAEILGSVGAKIGDGGTTNYIQVAADGDITLEGTARVKKYITIPAGSFRLGASAPDRGTEGTFATLLFASNVTQEAYHNVHVPADWATGTNMELAAYWTPTDGASGTVAWEFDWEAVKHESNETLGASSAHADIHDDTQELDNELLETQYGMISGTAVETDDTIGIKFYRDHDDAGDDYGADAALIHVEIEYIANRLGEAT